MRSLWHRRAKFLFRRRHSSRSGGGRSFALPGLFPEPMPRDDDEQAGGCTARSK